MTPGRTRYRGIHDSEGSADIRAGTVVRDRRWGGHFSGTVTHRNEDRLVVAWHGSCVEDELGVDEVDVWPDAPTELAGWQGGVGVLGRDGSFRVSPVP